MAAVFWALALASLCYPLASINAQSSAGVPSKLPTSTPSTPTKLPTTTPTAPSTLPTTNSFVPSKLPTTNPGNS
ncbi:hypothetical protein SESBI_36562 [Sesbania bispinosa]|nr:hypothetical protein SESBI_36562 [Sesbania bispinosa]